MVRTRPCTCCLLGGNWRVQSGPLSRSRQNLDRLSKGRNQGRLPVPKLNVVATGGRLGSAGRKERTSPARGTPEKDQLPAGVLRIGAPGVAAVAGRFPPELPNPDHRGQRIENDPRTDQGGLLRPVIRRRALDHLDTGNATLSNSPDQPEGLSW